MRLARVLETELVARYGDARLGPPRYDLEAARESIQIEKVADAAWGVPRAREPRLLPDRTGLQYLGNASADVIPFSMAEVDCGASQSRPKTTPIAIRIGPNTGRLFSERRVSL